MKMQEIEAKFYVQNLKAIKQRLEKLGAVLREPRVLEVNYRLDTPAGDLAGNRQVLRLRRDRTCCMTYKDNSSLDDGAQRRREIEFTVSDFDSALQLLEALGYVVFVMYEKYRTVYEYQGVEVMLDEMPYGNFCEVEGPDVQHIRAVAEALNLDWKRSVPISYLSIFNQLKQASGYDYQNLSFQEFQNHLIQLEDFGYQPADE